MNSMKKRTALNQSKERLKMATQQENLQWEEEKNEDDGLEEKEVIDIKEI